MFINAFLLTEKLKLENVDIILNYLKSHIF